MIEELSGILKVMILLSWMGVFVALSMRMVIKKKVDAAEKKEINIEKMRKMKDLFLSLRKTLVGSIIFLSAYVNLKFMLDVSSVNTLILVPGILIPTLIVVEIYLSITDNLLKKGGIKLEVEKE